MRVRSALAMLLALAVLSALARPADQGAALILSPTALGPLALGKGATVSKVRLKQLFPSFTVKYDIGQGDSPDFHYFEVTNAKGAVLFTIQSFVDESTDSRKTKSEVPIQLLKILSRQIEDSYGLRVGDRVKDLIAKRGTSLKFGAGHHDVYLGSGGICYNIATGSEWSPENLTMEDAVKGNWEIVSISWPGPAWE